MNNFIAPPTRTYPTVNHLETFIPQTQPYVTSYLTQANNRYVYVRQSAQSVSENISMPSSVHVNPRFNKNVFVNPNFHTFNNVLPTLNKIHINPNVNTAKLQLREQNNSNQIHVNPNVLHKNSLSFQRLKQELNPAPPDKKQEDIKRTVFSSRTKLIRTPLKTKTSPESRKTRRTSVRSKFKIVKACILNRSLTDVKFKTPLYKYKLVQCKTKSVNKPKNKFKLDNRVKENKPKLVKLKKQVRTESNNSLSLIKIGGVLYKKSTSSLQKANTKTKSRTLNKKISKSKYRLIRLGSKSKLSNIPMNSSDEKVTKIVKLKISKGRKVISPGKLRKCNIPCPYFKKFGRCKQHENGKCFRKHDPDQIALCTKFLQGACINEKCLLSHNVSLEKMPTCKFYLEGNCSKDQCTYLHVKISPKADVCKDFLEGFCKKGAECDKRHQYLCPDYEKNGECPKQRCPYPHGKMVRKYSVFDTNKFTKKCSDKKLETISKLDTGKSNDKINVINIENTEVAVSTRYYTDPENGEDFSKSQNFGDNLYEPTISIGTRPKLGELPSFIAFEES